MWVNPCLTEDRPPSAALVEAVAEPNAIIAALVVVDLASFVAACTAAGFAVASAAVALLLSLLFRFLMLRLQLLMLL